MVAEGGDVITCREILHDLHVRVANAFTGEFLRELTINPDRDYQPQPNKKTPET